MKSKLEKQLTSFEDACKIEELDHTKVIPDFALFPEEDREAMIKHAELVIIIRAANRIANDGKPWKANHDDSNQDKYEPYFCGGSSGFQYNDYDNWNSNSNVSSHLC